MFNDTKWLDSGVIPPSSISENIRSSATQISTYLSTQIINNAFLDYDTTREQLITKYFLGEEEADTFLEAVQSSLDKEKEKTSGDIIVFKKRHSRRKGGKKRIFRKVLIVVCDANGDELSREEWRRRFLQSQDYNDFSFKTLQNRFKQLDDAQNRMTDNYKRLHRKDEKILVKNSLRDRIQRFGGTSMQYQDAEDDEEKDNEEPEVSKKKEALERTSFVGTLGITPIGDEAASMFKDDESMNPLLDRYDNRRKYFKKLRRMEVEDNRRRRKAKEEGDDDEEEEEESNILPTAPSTTKDIYNNPYSHLMDPHSFVFPVHIFPEDINEAIVQQAEEEEKEDDDDALMYLGKRKKRGDLARAIWFRRREGVKEKEDWEPGEEMEIEDVDESADSGDEGDDDAYDFGVVQTIYMDVNGNVTKIDEKEAEDGETIDLANHEYDGRDETILAMRTSEEVNKASKAKEVEKVIKEEKTDQKDVEESEVHARLVDLFTKEMESEEKKEVTLKKSSKRRNELMKKKKEEMEKKRRLEEKKRKEEEEKRRKEEEEEEEEEEEDNFDQELKKKKEKEKTSGTLKRLSEESYEELAKETIRKRNLERRRFDSKNKKAIEEMIRKRDANDEPMATEDMTVLDEDDSVPFSSDADLQKMAEESKDRMIVASILPESPFFIPLLKKHSALSYAFRHFGINMSTYGDSRKDKKGKKSKKKLPRLPPPPPAPASVVEEALGNGNLAKRYYRISGKPDKPQSFLDNKQFFSINRQNAEEEYITLITPLMKDYEAERQSALDAVQRNLKREAMEEGIYMPMPDEEVKDNQAEAKRAQEIAVFKEKLDEDMKVLEDISDFSESEGGTEFTSKEDFMPSSKPKEEKPSAPPPPPPKKPSKSKKDKEGKKSKSSSSSSSSSSHKEEERAFIVDEANRTVSTPDGLFTIPLYRPPVCTLVSKKEQIRRIQEGIAQIKKVKLEPLTKPPKDKGSSKIEKIDIHPSYMTILRQGSPSYEALKNVTATKRKKEKKKDSKAEVEKKTGPDPIELASASLLPYVQAIDLAQEKLRMKNEESGKKVTDKEKRKAELDALDKVDRSDDDLEDNDAYNTDVDTINNQGVILNEYALSAKGLVEVVLCNRMDLERYCTFADELILNKDKGLSSFVGGIRDTMSIPELKIAASLSTFDGKKSKKDSSTQSIMSTKSKKSGKSSVTFIPLSVTSLTTSSKSKESSSKQAMIAVVTKEQQKIAQEQRISRILNDKGTEGTNDMILDAVEKLKEVLKKKDTKNYEDACLNLVNMFECREVASKVPVLADDSLVKYLTAALEDKSAKSRISDLINVIGLISRYEENHQYFLKFKTLDRVADVWTRKENTYTTNSYFSEILSSVCSTTECRKSILKLGVLNKFLTIPRTITVIDEYTMRNVMSLSLRLCQNPDELRELAGIGGIKCMLDVISKFNSYSAPIVAAAAGCTAALVQLRDTHSIAHDRGAICFAFKAVDKYSDYQLVVRNCWTYVRLLCEWPEGRRKLADEAENGVKSVVQSLDMFGMIDDELLLSGLSILHFFTSISRDNIDRAFNVDGVRIVSSILLQKSDIDNDTLTSTCAILSNFAQLNKGARAQLTATTVGSIAPVISLHLNNYKASSDKLCEFLCGVVYGMTLSGKSHMTYGGLSAVTGLLECVASKYLNEPLMVKYAMGALTSIVVQPEFIRQMLAANGIQITNDVLVRYYNLPPAEINNMTAKPDDDPRKNSFNGNKDLEDLLINTTALVSSATFQMTEDQKKPYLKHDITLTLLEIFKKFIGINEIICENAASSLFHLKFSHSEFSEFKKTLRIAKKTYVDNPKFHISTYEKPTQ